MPMIYNVVFNDRTDITTKENPRNLCYDTSIFVDCHKMEFGEWYRKDDDTGIYKKCLGWKENGVISINVTQILYIESKNVVVIE